MSISGDELHDMRLTDDREIEVGGDGDWRVTDGIDTVKQSVAIAAGSVLRPLIGEPLDGATYEDIQAELLAVLERDPQIESVTRVEIESVNRSSGVVTVTVHTSYNNSFELPIQVQ